MQVKNKNPRKGTETPHQWRHQKYPMPCPVKNKNPRKGTETMDKNLHSTFCLLPLKTKIPVRGRKPGTRHQSFALKSLSS